MIRRKSIHFLCLLAALFWAGSAQAQTLVTSGGGQLQIGTGLPLPVGPAGIFPGGTMVTTAGTFPPLLIGPVPGATVMQTGGTGQGGAISLSTGVLSFMADGVPNFIGVFPTNPSVWNVATTISYAWPASAAVLAPGGAPGPTVLGTTTSGGLITYSGGTKAFGGPAVFAVAAGPGSGAYAVPAAGTMAPIATVWINFAGALPATGMVAAIVGASAPLGIAAQGASVAAASATTAFPPVGGGVPLTPGGPLRTFNVPSGVGCTMWCPGPSGTVSLTVGSATWSQGPGMGAFVSNMVTNTKGFPFTTGLLTVSQPGAAEVFFLSGTDGRVAGSGSISLVAGSLSTRALSGPNANRAWITLPEPSAALGAAGALGVIFLAHALVRRRSR